VCVCARACVCVCVRVRVRVCTVHSGARETVPLVSELAEPETEDRRWTGVGGEDSSILADGTDQSSCV